MTFSTAYRVAGSAALCLVALAVGSATRLPAVAAEGFQRYIEPLTSTMCATSTPCLTETNTSTGAGVKGVSTSGNGSIGQTKFHSTSATNSKSGVLGQDISTSGTHDSGVLGTSTNGIGVQGTSVNGYGMMAMSANQSALFVENTGFSDGIQSVALNNDGVNTSTQNRSTMFGGRSGIYAHDDSTDGGHRNVGVAGASTNGIGISASSTNYVGLNVIGGGTVGQDYPALSVIGQSGGHSLITGCLSGTVNPCDSFDAAFVVDGVGDVITHASIDADGNVDILGQYQVNGSCVAGCVIANRKSRGSAIARYVPTASVPAVEDFGEAQLVDGQARVRLSPDFANVIEQRANYLVFITPEGDTNGLYVTQKTSSGFAVQENHGGRATVSFQYRIVAKPFGATGSRLQKVVTKF